MPTAAEIRARQAARAAGAAPPVPKEPTPADFTLEAALRASLVAGPTPTSALPSAVTGLGLAPQGLSPERPNVVDFSTVNRPTGVVMNYPVPNGDGTVSLRPAIQTAGVDVTEAPAVALREAIAAEAQPDPAVAADPADFPGQAGAERAEPAPAAPAAEPRRGRGRPRKPRPAEPAPAAPADATQVERLERIATALQAVADAADSAVQTVNAELRALGVRL